MHPERLGISSEPVAAKNGLIQYLHHLEKPDSGIKHLQIGGPMGLEKPDWQRLCEAAANEEDPKKLAELMTKISRGIKEKEDRLRQQYQPLRQAPTLGD